MQQTENISRKNDEYVYTLYPKCTVLMRCVDFSEV
jgi:hypothetical protein